MEGDPPGGRTLGCPSCSPFPSSGSPDTPASHQPTHRYPACGGWGTMGQALGLEAGVLPLLDAFIVLPASVFPAPQWV